MLNGLQPWHFLILILLVVLLFGAKRLPDTARSLARSMKIFKAETGGAGGEEPAEPKQLSTPDGQARASAEQISDLQRQLDEMKRQ